jgi:hypothetical protein
MNASSSEHHIIQLHQKILKVLATTTMAKPVSQTELQKLADQVVGGQKVLDQFLEKLIVDKAIMRSKGMRDSAPYAAYWATNSFGAAVVGVKSAPVAREFTTAEKSLIRKVHGWMPPEQLLALLNERLVSDVGPNTALYKMEQLYQTIGDGVIPAAGGDWASLRKIISKAKRSGVLDLITEQNINDFAVVYSLNAKQVLVLKDIVLQAKGDE